MSAKIKIAKFIPSNIPTVEIEIPDTCPKCQADLTDSCALRVGEFVYTTSDGRVEGDQVESEIDEQDFSDALAMHVICRNCDHDFANDEEVPCLTT